MRRCDLKERVKKSKNRNGSRRERIRGKRGNVTKTGKRKFARRECKGSTLKRRYKVKVSEGECGSEAGKKKGEGEAKNGRKREGLRCAT